MKLKTLALAATMAVTLPALADTVKLTGFVFNPAKTVSTSDSLNPANSHGSTLAGEFKGFLNGNSFVTYCTDLAQTFAFNVTYTDYSLVSGLTAWGATKSGDVDRALSNVISFGQPINAVQSAAIQAILWEILYEKPGNPYNFAAGTFKVTSADGPTQTLLNSVNWGSLPLTPITWHADKLQSREHQDFLVIRQVPEPGTYAMLAAGLAGIGFVARRRGAQQV
jgi:hypothetical protein